MTRWGYIDKSTDPRDISPVTGWYTQKTKEYQYLILDKDNQQRGDYIYRLLDRKPKREYPSPIKVNISRINYTKGRKEGFTTIGYWAENRKEKETRYRLG